MGAWARQTTSPVAWLSLTSFDRHPSRLERGLLTALEPVVGPGAEDLTELLQREVDDAVLVLDDVHLVGAEAAGVLGLLVDRAPSGLRIVLISRHRPLLRLQRINAAGGLGEVSVDQLAFSTEDVRRAAEAIGRPLTPDQAVRLRALTAGWPVAVRLALMSGPTITGRLVTGGQLRAATLTDYLLEEVLGDLPTALRDFLLRVSITDWLTGRLAIELSGDPWPRRCWRTPSRVASRSNAATAPGVSRSTAGTGSSATSAGPCCVVVNRHWPTSCTFGRRDSSPSPTPRSRPAMRCPVGRRRWRPTSCSATG